MLFKINPHHPTHPSLKPVSSRHLTQPSASHGASKSSAPNMGLPTLGLPVMQLLSKVPGVQGALDGLTLDFVGVDAFKKVEIAIPANKTKLLGILEDPIKDAFNQHQKTLLFSDLVGIVKGQILPIYTLLTGDELTPEQAKSKDAQPLLDLIITKVALLAVDHLDEFNDGIAKQAVGLLGKSLKVVADILPYTPAFALSGLINILGNIIDTASTFMGSSPHVYDDETGKDLSEKGILSKAWGAAMTVLGSFAKSVPILGQILGALSVVSSVSDVGTSAHHLVRTLSRKRSASKLRPETPEQKAVRELTALRTTYNKVEAGELSR
jgi:hypothetical protein